MSTTLVRTGDFTLRMDTDGSTKSYGSSTHQGQTSFEGKYRIKCPADKVPFIVVPLNSSTNGKSAGQMVGYCALVVDNNKKTSTYAMVGDAGPGKNGWGEVSLKCAWNLGYSENEANGRQGPASNFSIYVDTTSYPNWSGDYNNLCSQIVSEGKSRFGGQTLGTTINTSYGSAVSGNFIMRESINWDYLDYYIITIDRHTRNLNYSELKKNNVAGVIIEAGYLYDITHSEVYYRNPKVHEQCMTANEAKVPFGLYCDAKARNVDEAKKELYELSFLIRKYPPVLGMWVHFQLSGSKTSNDSIIRTYLKGLVRLGLKGKVGIIATEKEIESMSWKEEHYKDWIMWLNKHVESVADIEQLLTPELFVV